MSQLVPARLDARTRHRAELQRAVIASDPALPAARQDLTEQDFEEYRLAHQGRLAGRRL